MENSKKEHKKRVPAKTTCRNRTKEINKLSINQLYHRQKEKEIKWEILS